MSIYGIVQTFLFLLTTPGSVNGTAPFAVNSLIIDNHTNQFLYVPAAKRYVPPYVSGMIVEGSHSSSVSATIATPPGITAANIISGQQALVTATEDRLPPSPGVATSLNANITNSTVDANITNSSINTNITNAALNANITNSNINATVTNSQVDINNVTPNIEMSALIVSQGVGAASTTNFGSIPVGDHIRGWAISSTTTGQINLYFGPIGSAGFAWWTAILSANIPSGVIFAPGLSISAPVNENYVWVYSQVTTTIMLSLYYSAT